MDTDQLLRDPDERSSPLKTLPECLDAAAPMAVRAVDLELQLGHLQLPSSASGVPYRTLLALVRRNGMPQGWAVVDAPSDGRVPLGALTSAVAQTTRNGGSSATAAGTPACTERSREGARRVSPEPLLTVVVATCAGVASTLRCVEAIKGSETGPCEIVIVENRPAGSGVRRALEERFGSDSRIRYVEEARPGLASARNAGIRVARGELIAFTDDDVVVDPRWIRSIRDAFSSHAEVGCVTGLILPLEFETPTQRLVERFASYAKGFVPRVYSIDHPPPDQPLFPYAAGHFGSGANIAFRTDLLRRLGGFDPALGTGTPARGSEDLDIFIRVLHSKSSLAYEPRAMVWHRHPDTDAGLRRRAFDYGAALGAMLTKQLVTGPTRWRIASLAPRGARYFLSPGSRKNAGRARGFPRTLIALELAGLLYGPVAYFKSVLSTPSKSYRRLTGDALLLALGIASVALCAVGAQNGLRLVVVLATACLLPGAALLARLDVEDTLERCALAVGLSLGIEAAGSLAMAWTGWWHPYWWALTLIAGACVLLTRDLAGNLRQGPTDHWVGPRIIDEGIARPTGDGTMGQLRDGLRVRSLRLTQLHPLLPFLPAMGAVAVWRLSLLGLNGSHLGNYGLPPALPLAWYLALLVSVVGAVLAICLPRTNQLLMFTYVAVAALILFATVPLLSAQPHYAWVYKHIGVVRFLEVHGSINPSVDIYNRWPGFFALAAVFSTVAGQANPVAYAAWADFVFLFLDVLLLMAAVKAVTRDARVAAGAGLLFSVTNWVGQTYYSPQAFASLLALALLAIALRQLGVQSVGRRPRLVRVLERVGRTPQLPLQTPDSGRWPRWVALTIVLGLDAVIVASHQLTPYMLLISMALLIFLGFIRPWWLLTAMAAMTVTYLAINFHFIQHNYGLFTSIDPFNNVQGPKITQHPSAGKVFNTRVELVFIALVWLGTLWASVRLLRRGLLLRAAPFLVLAVAPAAVVFGQNYGGEASLRIILFSSPWCSALIAWAAITITRPGVRIAVLAAVACMFTGLFVISYLGQEELNILSPREVAASEWFYDHAPRGSVLVLAAPGFPYRLGASYPDFRGPEGDANPNLLTEPVFQGRPLGDAQVPAIAARIHEYSPHGYVAFARDETTFAEVFRITPHGALDQLEAAVARSSLFRLWYTNRDAQIFEATAPPPAPAPPPIVQRSRPAPRHHAAVVAKG